MLRDEVVVNKGEGFLEIIYDLGLWRSEDGGRFGDKKIYRFSCLLVNFLFL